MMAFDVRLFLVGLFIGLTLGDLLYSPAFGQQPTADRPLSALELRSAATASQDRIQVHIAAIVDLIRQAQEQGDAAGLQCVRDKLVAARSMGDVATLATSELTEALASQQLGRAQAAGRKVQVAEARVDALRNEAAQCLARRVDGTTVERNASGEGAVAIVDPCADLFPLWQCKEVPDPIESTPF